MVTPFHRRGHGGKRGISEFLGATQLVNLFPGPPAPLVGAPAPCEVLGESQNL